MGDVTPEIAMVADHMKEQRRKEARQRQTEKREKRKRKENETSLALAMAMMENAVSFRLQTARG